MILRNYKTKYGVSNSETATITRELIDIGQKVKDTKKGISLYNHEIAPLIGTVFEDLYTKIDRLPKVDSSTMEPIDMGGCFEIVSLGEEE